ncbi:DUF3426 domain-containing protein [Nitrosopumilus sp.]|uniref:DUF3426 domain-containing protein n=1 Tax=Nitrosopumilus sp. TaxID=2024843 RepID=UPI00260225A1|nr:DUF3426 domain-containing protein [Nitrosopumilus sp.]
MEKSILGLVIFSSLIPFAFAEVTIQNDQKYIGDDGSLHIVGEIINDLEAPLNQISVHVTLFNENQNVIAVKETNSLVNTVMPGMKGPFDLILINEEAVNTESYILELDYEISPPKSQVIEITESELSRDNLGNLMIKGTVANQGEFTANTVAVIATLYDNEGNVAAVSRVHPEPDYLKTKDNAFFLISVPDKIQTQGIDKYELIAESEEFAAVPEFPIGTLIVLVGTLSAYIGITKFSGKFIVNLISATNLK